MKINKVLYIVRLCTDLKALQHKQKKQEWDRNLAASSIGFSRFSDN
jgi:hypothetical protein